MRKVNITQEQFNQLCACGRKSFNEYNLFVVNWLTYYKKIVIFQDVRTEQNEMAELVVEENA